jgi:hypothetical protein
VLSYQRNILTDITPLIRSVTLGTDPFSATIGLPVVEVTDVALGLGDGVFVRFSGATAFAGFTTDQINAEFQITVTSVDTYEITFPVNAGATVAGGGSSVQADYLLQPTSLKRGWGAGPWGAGPWGRSGTATVNNSEPGFWSFDNWGEDLFLNPRGGALYYYDVTNPTVPAVRLDSLMGATDVPARATYVLVEPELRYAIAFGCAPIGSSDRDPMFVRWSDRGSIINWSPSPLTTAGGIRLSYGSRILAAVKMRREIALFTDTTLYSMQPVSTAAVFQFTVITPKVSLIGPSAFCVNRDNQLFWMERDGFSRYDGRVEALDCDVLDRVFDNFNFGRANQVVCGENPRFFEIIWCYPSAGSAVNDRYVIYNYRLNRWYTGSVIKRSAWLSTPLFQNPIAASDNGLFYHEQGYDDNDTGSPVAIPTFVRSAPLEVAEGNRVLTIGKVIPDFSFGTTPTAITPSLNFTIISSDYPGSVTLQTQDSGILADVNATVNEVTPYTDELFVNVRGRKIEIQIQNEQLGVFWRGGLHRLWARKDGRR